MVSAFVEYMLDGVTDKPSWTKEGRGCSKTLPSWNDPADEEQYAFLFEFYVPYYICSTSAHIKLIYGSGHRNSSTG